MRRGAATESSPSRSCSLAQVTGFKGTEEVGKALDGADIVVIPAGVPRKPGMTRDDLFNTNATIVRNLARACAKCVRRARAHPRIAGIP